MSPSTRSAPRCRPGPARAKLFSSTEPGSLRCKLTGGANLRVSDTGRREHVRAGQQLHESFPDPNEEDRPVARRAVAVIRKTMPQTTPDYPRAMALLIGRGVSSSLFGPQ